jgi:hypothetical protein
LLNSKAVEGQMVVGLLVSVLSRLGGASQVDQ